MDKQVFANVDNFDFEYATYKGPLQQLDVAVGREVGGYAVKSAKFSNVSSVTLFLPASQGAETTRIYYVGFLGQWSERKQEPVINVYEFQANIADHEEYRVPRATFPCPRTEGRLHTSQEKEDKLGTSDLYF
ncbi:hypothetical protein EDB84DRAFT_1438138 [Lactarius hengduanensis]|nr:hypothetical protein EDB84DRAFT_1438138 [Lactarius hengduanensis]